MPVTFCIEWAKSLMVALVLFMVSVAGAAEPVTVVLDGKAVLPVFAGSEVAPVEELIATLERMTGAVLERQTAATDAAGLYVGLIADFPAVKVEGNEGLGEEGFVIRSQNGSLYLLAERPLGVARAVTTFLHLLGHRQFFPGKTWEVVPQLTTVAGSWNERQVPSYRSQRRLWYGFGAYPPNAADLNVWNHRNRMGGPEPVGIGHTWYGLNREQLLAEDPEQLALVEREGKLVRHASKPCYSHPKVIEQMVNHALAQAAAGATSVSLSPPDGLGYCICDLCREVFQGGEPFAAHSTLFAARPDGVVVNITSETLFRAVNRVAEVLAVQYPDVVVGCYAYSAYSHPVSFDLHPNIFIQTTTAYRRTPMTLDEQLEGWGRRAANIGIREYWSVYQWDWDNPDPGKMRPDRLQATLQHFLTNKVTAMNAEASNNWAPRGLGYYVGARLLWDVEADVTEVVRDFYELAFGPAAPAMERYYARWYGPSAVVGIDPRAPEIAASGTAGGEAGAGDNELTDSGPVYGHGEPDGTRRTLAAAFADLDEATRLVADAPAHLARVDNLRMYAYYLWLRSKAWQASAAKEPTAIIAAVREETIFGGRLTYTNMLHSRPLIGKAFHRRFRNDMAVLADVEEAAEWSKGWRVIGTPPEHEELNRLWQAALADLK